MPAAHVLRPPQRRQPANKARPMKKPRPPQAAPTVYAPGHFTELVRLYNWPPMFEPQLRRTREVEQSELSRINREARVAQGDTGTIVGLTLRADALMMQRMMPALGLR